MGYIPLAVPLILELPELQNLLLLGIVKITLSLSLSYTYMYVMCTVLMYFNVQYIVYAYNY